jgi:hypothetical protein
LLTLTAACCLLLCAGCSCRALREAETKAPGFQRLRMAQYDELRKKLVSSHGGKLVKGEVGAALWWR